MARGKLLDVFALCMALSAHFFMQLEKGLGSRPQLAANPEIDVPAFNGMGEQLAAQWPQLEVALDGGLLQLHPHCKGRAVRCLSPGRHVPDPELQTDNSSR